MDLMSEIGGWINAAKGAVDLLKSTAGLLPKGEKRSAIETQIRAAEVSLQASHAKLGRELGMKLCDCSFPPQIMLWKEAEKAHVCPNPACGRTKKPGMRISQEALSSTLAI